MVTEKADVVISSYIEFSIGGYLLYTEVYLYLSVCKIPTSTMYFDNKSHSTTIQGVSMSSLCFVILNVFSDVWLAVSHFVSFLCFTKKQGCMEQSI